MTTIPSSVLAAVTGGCGGGGRNKQAQAPQGAQGPQQAAQAQGPAQSGGQPKIRDLLQAILAKLDGLGGGGAQQQPQR